jgi:hypothetical protein
MFLGLVLLVLLNVPIAVALGIVAVAAMVATSGPDILPDMALVMYGGATSFPLLAIPLFILAGAIMNALASRGGSSPSPPPSSVSCAAGCRWSPSAPRSSSPRSRDRRWRMSRRSARSRP